MLVLFTGVLSGNLSFCEERLTYANRPYYGWVNQIELSNQYALVGAGASLLVFDIQDAANPKLVSTLDFPDHVNQIQTRDRCVFITTYSRFYIVSLANPRSPRIAYTFATNSTIYSVCIQDSLFFFAAEDLFITRWLPSGELSAVAKYSHSSYITQVAVRGDRAIIGIDEHHHADGRLQLLDIKDVSAPRLLWDEFGLVPNQISIVDSLALVARLGGIAVYKINSQSLKKSGQTTNLSVVSFIADQKTLYLAAGHAGVVVLDFVNINDLKKSGAFSTIGSVQDLEVRKGIVYLADHSGGLQILDVRDWDKPKLLSQFDRTLVSIDLWATRSNLYNRALFADKNYPYYSRKDFQILDNQNPLLPSLLSKTALPLSTGAMFIKDRFAYFTVSSESESGVAIYDIANAKSPRRIGLITSPGNNEAVFVQKNLLFLASQGLRIFDISNLSAPRFIAEFSVPGTSTDGIFVMNDLVFLWGFSQLYILTIRNLPQLELINEIKIGIANIAISPDTIAFIARGDRGLDVWDLSQPKNPTVLAKYADGDPVNDVDLNKNFLFLAGDRFCRVLDISNPRHPNRLARSETTIAASQVRYLESHSLVYLAGYSLGMLILKFEKDPVSVQIPRAEPPSNFQLFQNYPNPFNPSTKIRYVIPKTSHVLLKIYDHLGHEMTTLVKETKAAGEYEVPWSAESLPSGVYVYRLQAGDFVETRKLVLLQ